MNTIDPIHIGEDAISGLIAYCQARNLAHFALIADRNTFHALGERVESALTAQNWEVTRIVLDGEEIIADEHYLLQALIEAPLGECMFLAVGSGTLTDITRFTSHRSGRHFISLPTAPSVDGFTSIGAPLVIGGVKKTLNCQPPDAVFADLDTLRQAPPPLVAAGFGDMLGKITSLADWQLGHLLWDEPFDETIFKRSKAAVESCLAHADAIGQHTKTGVENLMNALIESGLCMLDFGSSRPASGAEHHCSHYWEMKLLQEGRPAVLHGAKVGVATALVAGVYEQVRGLEVGQVGERLAHASLPARSVEEASIRAGYGPLAEQVTAEHLPFLELSPDDFERLKGRVHDNWEAIVSIARLVPPAAQIRDFLRRAGAATDGEALGLSPEEIRLGLRYGHYLRNRFTVMKLARLLDLQVH